MAASALAYTAASIYLDVTQPRMIRVKGDKVKWLIRQAEAAVAVATRLKAREAAYQYRLRET